MKVFAGYEVTDKPWGGANNFLRSLYKTLQQRHGVEITYVPDSSCDVFFFGQMGRGPLKGSGQYSLDDLREISELNPQAPLIMRLVNIRRHSSHDNFLTYLLSKKDRASDAEVLKGAAYCDGVVFQSGYQEDFFKKYGFEARDFTVIHNGAASEFSSYAGEIPVLHEGERMKLYSSSVSTKGCKNHKVISELSCLDQLDVIHAGEWPEFADKGKVTFLGTIDHVEALKVLSGCHYYLHPGFKEVCSNSIIESLAAGLPVLYGQGPSGSKEIVGQNGIMLDESRLGETMRMARDWQAELVERLKAARQLYGMERAADKYFEFFQLMMKKKNRQKAV